MSRQLLLFTASFLWCSPWLCSWTHSIMYATPLSSIITQTSAWNTSQVDHHLYADDTQLFISFSPHAAQAALDSLHVTLAAISQWMASNFLTLNPSKTEFLVIGLPTQLSKLQMPNLTLPNNSSVTLVESARNLGIVFDSNHSFDKDISNLSKTCYYHIRDLRRIHTTLDFDTARTFATSLIHSKLDYCNSLVTTTFHSHNSSDSSPSKPSWLVASLPALVFNT